MQSPSRLKKVLIAGVLILAVAVILRTRFSSTPDAATQRAQQEISALEQSLIIQPGNVELRYRLSDYYVQMGRSADAIRTVNDGCALNLGDVQCWLTLGDLQQQNNQLRTASLSYNKALAIVPNNAGVLCAVAQLEIKRGRERHAKQLLDRVAKSGENLGLYHFMRAQLLMRTAPSELAVAELKKSVQLEPKFIASWLLFAQASALLNQIADVEEACRGALALAPNNADALTILSRSKLQKGSSQATQDAHKLAEQALFSAPQHQQAQAILGMLALRAGNVETAIDHLEIALTADGADIEVRANLAKAYQRAGRAEEAAKQLKVLQSEIEFSERVRHLLTRAKLHPNNADLRGQIGNLYASVGANEKAAAQYEAALEIDPRHKAALQGLQQLGDKAS